MDTLLTQSHKALVRMETIYSFSHPAFDSFLSSYSCVRILGGN